MEHKIETTNEGQFLELNAPSKRRFSLADMSRIEEACGIPFERIERIQGLRLRLRAIDAGEDLVSDRDQVERSFHKACEGVSLMKVGAATIWAHYRATNPWLTFKQFCEIDIDALGELTELVMEHQTETTDEDDGDVPLLEGDDADPLAQDK